MRFKTILTCILLIICVNFSSSQVITLITYNIRYDTRNNDRDTWSARKDFLGNQLKFFEPDIFGIQEGMHHQVMFLDSILIDYKYTGVGRDDGKRAGEYSAIFYNSKKFKILTQSTFWLSETIHTPSVGWAASMERICTYALFQNNESGQKLWIFNTHFDHIGVEARKNSARLIVEQIYSLNKEQYPVVLMGDLNLEPDNEAIRYLTGVFNDSRFIAEEVAFGPEGTNNEFNVRKPVKKRIDYILTDKSGIRVNKFAILSETFDGRYPSDHFPVYAEIVLLGTREK